MTHCRSICVDLPSLPIPLSRRTSSLLYIRRVMIYTQWSRLTPGSILNSSREPSPSYSCDTGHCVVCLNHFLLLLLYILCIPHFDILLFPTPNVDQTLASFIV